MKFEVIGYDEGKPWMSSQADDEDSVQDFLRAMTKGDILVVLCTNDQGR